VLNSNISPTCSHNMVNFGPLVAETGWWVWDNPRKFQRVSRLRFVTAPTTLNEGQPNFARCSAVSRASALCIHFRRLLPPKGILPGAKFTLRASLACVLLYWQRYCTYSSSGRQPNFAAFSRGRHLYSAGRPSRLASAHILVYYYLCVNIREYDACYNIR